MNSFQIISDGACDMEKTIASEGNVKIIPFYVSLDGETYQKEIEQLSLDTFYHSILNDKIFPKTSLPSVQDYIDVFQPILDAGHDILCLTITQTLSGSLQSASTAKQILEETYKDSKIMLLDSWQATGSQYLLVEEAVRIRQSGLSLEACYELLEKMKIDAGIVFMVGALKHLEKGGRIGKLAALSGSILNIKPIILLKNGEICTGGVARSRKKAFKKIADILAETFEKQHESYRDYRFKLGATNAPEELSLFLTTIKEVFPECKVEPSFTIGATIASHTGPDTYGACFVKKFEHYLNQ